LLDKVEELETTNERLMQRLVRSTFFSTLYELESSWFLDSIFTV